jgi:hypothetical protein
MLETRMFVHAGKQYDRSISSAKRPNTVSWIRSIKGALFWTL